jgi:hypothetical protein
MSDRQLEEHAGIDVKEAVSIARAFLHELYQSEELRDLLLEEIELTDDEQNWFITFGFGAPRAPKTGFEAMKAGIGLSEPIYERIYKTIRVRASDGEVRAMKIREV